MTKINISPAWKDVKPRGFYVYLHRRATDGTVFYVGKGKGRRAWERYGRNDWWKNVFYKNGAILEILYQDLEEFEAFRLEEIVIKNYEMNGANLCNMTSGGEGASGAVPSYKTRIKISRASGGRKVYSSQGESFETAALAEEYLISIGFTKARKSHISKCAKGLCNSAYLRSWWYEGERPREYIEKSKRYSNTAKIAVYCSNGMKFDSARDAEKWLKSIGFKKACHSAISESSKKYTGVAYGLAWWREGDSPKKPAKQREKRKICCSNGMTFVNIKSAATWIKLVNKNACEYAIDNCCKGRICTAYGFSWWYEGDKKKPYVKHFKSILCSNGMEFNSRRQAVLWLNDGKYSKSVASKILKACKGDSDEEFGFKWKFKNTP